jgi:hypothetical protein
LSKYREAVATQSPGLLQPWDHRRQPTNRNAVAARLRVPRNTIDATAENRSGRNPFRVDKSGAMVPRVEATLGFESQPLRGKEQPLSPLVIKHRLRRLSVIR